MTEQKGGTAIKDRSEFREDYKEPRRYKVYVLNDDFTTFDFVVYVMQAIFSKTRHEGWNIARCTHNEGKGYIGTYSYDMAKTKSERAKALSRSFGYPLNFKLTPEGEDEQ
jgi:ATP-dependent Clp protease adaptor protein ClpS